MSGLFGSTTIKGTRITDFAQTSADVGSTIPFLYGRAPVKGNVIFAALPPKENRTVKKQGKGGVKQETFTYTTSYAVSFCWGPVRGFWWIKRQGKVVYTQDPSVPIEDKDFAAKWASKMSMYFGTDAQLPNSVIESYKGSGKVSAFKNLVYIVLPHEDVTQNGGAIPDYEAVPIASPAEIYLTSHPYTQVIYDNVKMNFRPVGGEMVLLLKESDLTPTHVEMLFEPIGGDLFVVPPPEFFDDITLGMLPNGGELLTPPVPVFKDAATLGFAPVGGFLAAPPRGDFKDAATLGFVPTGGSLA